MRAQLDSILKVSSANLESALRQRDHEMEAKTAKMEQRLQAELDRKSKEMKVRESYNAMCLVHSLR